MTSTPGNGKVRISTGGNNQNALIIPQAVNHCSVWPGMTTQSVGLNARTQ